MSHVDIPVVLGADQPVPLWRQLADSLRCACLSGVLAPGQRLPSTRALAATLGVSRTVVTSAYDQLFAEGFLDARHGAGTYLADIGMPDTEQAGAAREPTTRPEPARLRSPFELGTPALAGPGERAWRQALRAAASSGPLADPDPRGLPGLRAALAQHLRRSRGLARHPDEFFVTAGATHALRFLADVLLGPSRKVGVEDPGFPAAQQAIASTGAELVACRVDDDGLEIAGLRHDLDLLVCAPSHQWPLGGRLPVGRRRGLLEWSRASDTLVVEDDFNNEFRYDSAPLPALAGSDPRRVAYVGTTSQILGRGTGLGWVVGEPEFIDRLAAHRWHGRELPPVVYQEALRIMIERGELERQVRRTRRMYAARRAALVRGFPRLGCGSGARLPGFIWSWSFRGDWKRGRRGRPSLSKASRSTCSTSTQ